ncbi:hypothetical protein PL321_09675 [Caloramator sp. mosi_1]|uniref:hypothetical protein n=1 Tax=Caloramator sp. mosi_1 TaxID=3023090 RepID=UPI00235EBAEE|nr:hypothetical protein [Caloramator sp. mosi_1]WDC85508.1 hypothetical protein PL321_09675 [Caloramator sp. mosi_1]
MKQKVAIARAIVHNPDVMLLTEPTIGLDVSSSAIVQDFILDCKKKGRTIIFSSHSMREVEKLCDRVVIIHKGRLVYDGRIEDLRREYNGEDLEKVFLRLVGIKMNSLWGIVFRKELKDLFRDRKTVIMSVVLPLVLFPLLFGLIGRGVKSSTEKVANEVKIAYVGGESSLKSFLSQVPNIKIIETQDYKEAIKKVVYI